MADGIKISELPEIETLQDGCCFPVISEIDGTMQNVKIKKVNLEKTLASNVFSTEETVCGKWIDGKPVYRKAWVISSIGSIGVLLNNVKAIIKQYGWFGTPNTSVGGYDKLPFGGMGNANYSIPYCYADVSANNATARIYTNYRNSPAEIILEYTKTTD